MYIHQWENRLSSVEAIETSVVERMSLLQPARFFYAILETIITVTQSGIHFQPASFRIKRGCIEQPDTLWIIFLFSALQIQPHSTIIATIRTTLCKDVVVVIELSLSVSELIRQYHQHQATASPGDVQGSAGVDTSQSGIEACMRKGTAHELSSCS